MNSHLSLLFTQFVSIVRSENLLAMSEGLCKIRCIEAALTLGWTIQEGAGHSPMGPVADFARMEQGKIVWRRGRRRLALDSGSADMAVVAPIQMQLEITSRPDYGTKAQAQFQEMDADISRIAGRCDCAFLFVFAPRIYLSFSGEKRETRGRRAMAADWFNSVFPQCAKIIPDVPLIVPAQRDSCALDLVFYRVAQAWGGTTIIVGGCRRDATFQAALDRSVVDGLPNMEVFPEPTMLVADSPNPTLIPEGDLPS